MCGDYSKSKVAERIAHNSKTSVELGFFAQGVCRLGMVRKVATQFMNNWQTSEVVVTALW